MSADTQKERLLSFLHSCAEKGDRATMANLRCALSATRQTFAWPILGRFGGINSAGKEYDHRAKTIQTIAGLFATHPKDTKEGDFGTACRKLMSNDEKLADPKDVGPIGKRFQHLLSSERTEICDRIVRLVQQMKAKEIPVNFAELYDGLWYWGDRQKNKWAGSFWGAPELGEAAE